MRREEVREDLFMAQNSNDELKIGDADLGLSMILMNPIGELKVARERTEWYSGLSKAVTSFQYFGRNAIKAYFKLHGVGLDETRGELKEDFAKFIEGFDISKIIQLLYWFDMIRKETRNQMFKINDERVIFEHTKKGMGYQYQDDKHFQNLLDQAIDCVKKLMSIRLAKKKLRKKR